MRPAITHVAGLTAGIVGLSLMVFMTFTTPGDNAFTAAFLAFVETAVSGGSLTLLIFTRTMPESYGVTAALHAVGHGMAALLFVFVVQQANDAFLLAVLALAGVHLIVGVLGVMDLRAKKLTTAKE